VIEARNYPALLEILPVTSPIKGSVRVPGSKSITNRALLLSVLANGKTIHRNALFSDDTLVFAQALGKLGFEIALDEDQRLMEVNGRGGVIPVQEAMLDAGNAGTAARFLTALVTLGTGKYTLDGSARMRERPIGDLVAALTMLGAEIKNGMDDDGAKKFPLQVIADGLEGGLTKISGRTSSQFLSALLMTAPYAEKPVEIEITDGLNSRPYVALTMKMMEDFGVSAANQNYERFQISPDFFESPGEYVIESDASSASYFFAIPAVCGGFLTVENISLTSNQGDIGFLEILARMGCGVSERNHTVTVIGPENLKGVDVDMRDISDTAQTLAAIAPFADSPTRIRGIASNRVKETDRISAVCAELTRIGVRVDEFEDGMTIYPADEIKGGVIQTYNDHRMAMSFALTGMRAPGIVIDDPGCVTKTFPDFFDVLWGLR